VISSAKKLNLNQFVLMLRWPIVAIIGIWVLVVELLEHPDVLEGGDKTFLYEVIVLEGLLVAVGLTVGWLVKIIREKSSMVKILEAKNELSQQLTSADDWDQMTNLLVEYPRTILPLEAASLLIYSPETKQFELTSYWAKEASSSNLSSRVPIPHRCSKCAYSQPFKLRPVEALCDPAEDALEIGNDYCLPLSYGDSMRAILQLGLPRNVKPPRDRVEMLNNLGPEMVISLRAAHENNIREKMAAEKAAEEARQGITRDMHDTLAQNLAYMQLKLDQMLQQNLQTSAEEYQPNLQKLRDVADESYDLVRSTLGALHPMNSRRLGEILTQYAYAFADRTDLEIRFSQDGQPQLLDPLVNHHVLQIYREVLNNVNKHADASRVETRLLWMDDCFELDIKDDGRGLESQGMQTDSHYGLQFMAERVEELNGELSINSVQGEGTSITITVPMSSIGRVSSTPAVK
jgi:signal transduction histidine kinase